MTETDVTKFYTALGMQTSQERDVWRQTTSMINASGGAIKLRSGARSTNEDIHRWVDRIIPTIRDADVLIFDTSGWSERVAWEVHVAQVLGKQVCGLVETQAWQQAEPLLQELGQTVRWVFYDTPTDNVIADAVQSFM